VTQRVALPELLEAELQPARATARAANATILTAGRSTGPRP
jgi:hypothetical protein